MTKNKKLYVILGIVGAVIIALCIVLISIFSNNSDNNTLSAEATPTETATTPKAINPIPIVDNKPNPSVTTIPEVTTSVYTMENGTSVFVQPIAPLPETYDPEAHKPEGTPAGFTTQTFTAVPETTSPPYTSAPKTTTVPTGTDASGLPTNPEPFKDYTDKNGTTWFWSGAGWIHSNQGPMQPGITFNEDDFSDDWDVLVGY